MRRNRTENFMIDNNGFIINTTTNKWVSKLTKVGYNYEYFFISPYGMNDFLIINNPVKSGNNYLNEIEVYECDVNTGIKKAKNFMMITNNHILVDIISISRDGNIVIALVDNILTNELTYMPLNFPFKNLSNLSSKEPIYININKYKEYRIPYFKFIKNEVPMSVLFPCILD